MVKLKLEISLFYFFDALSKYNRFIKAIIPYSIFTNESGRYPIEDFLVIMHPQVRNGVLV